MFACVNLLQFFCAWIKNRDIDEKWIKHFEQIWYFCDEKSIIVWSRLISEIDENEKIFVIIDLKSFNDTNLSWSLNHLSTESRKHREKIFNMLFFLYLTANSIKWCRKFALLTEMRNSFQRLICLIKLKKSIFMKLMIFDLIVSITVCSDVFSTIFSATTIFCFIFSTATRTARFERSFVAVEQNKIDWKEFSFEFFETCIEFEFTTRRTSDWIKTLSSFDLIEIEFELKLIANSSDLNDLKNLLNLNSEFATTWISDWLNDNIVDVEQNKIDRKDVEFKLFEIDMKIEFKTKTTCDLMINSKSDIVDVELKLIVNFLDLNDLKNLLNLILKRDLKLTTTSTTFNLIAFWAMKTIFFVFNACVNEQ